MACVAAARRRQAPSDSNPMTRADGGHPGISRSKAIRHRVDAGEEAHRRAAPPWSEGKQEYGRAGFGCAWMLPLALEAHIKEVRVHPAARCQLDGCGWPDWWLLEASTEARGAHVYSPAREGDRQRICSVFSGLQAHRKPTMSVYFSDREKGGARDIKDTPLSYKKKIHHFFFEITQYN